jgi:hypothetical protein
MPHKSVSLKASHTRVLERADGSDDQPMDRNTNTDSDAQVISDNEDENMKDSEPEETAEETAETELGKLRTQHTNAIFLT